MYDEVGPQFAYKLVQEGYTYIDGEICVRKARVRAQARLFQVVVLVMPNRERGKKRKVTPVVIAASASTPA